MHKAGQYVLIVAERSGVTKSDAAGKVFRKICGGRFDRLASRAMFKERGSRSTAQPS